MSADLNQPLALSVRAKAVTRVSFMQIFKDQATSRGVSCPAEGLPARNFNVNVFTTKFAGPIHPSVSGISGKAKRIWKVLTLFPAIRTNFGMRRASKSTAMSLKDCSKKFVRRPTNSQYSYQRTFVTPGMAHG